MGCAVFAQIDIFDGKALYETWFSFKPTEPHNENYEMMDIGDKNFIHNSGSYFIFNTMIIVFNGIAFILNKIAIRNSK